MFHDPSLGIEIVMDAIDLGVKGVEALNEQHLLFGAREKNLLKHIVKVVPVKHALCVWEQFFPVLFWEEVLRRAVADGSGSPPGGESASSSSSTSSDGVIPTIWSPHRLPWKQRTPLSGDTDHGDGAPCFSSCNIYVFRDRTTFARALGPEVVSSLGGNANTLEPVFNGPKNSLDPLSLGLDDVEFAHLIPFLAPTKKFDRKHFQENVFVDLVEQRVNHYPFAFDPRFEGNGGRSCTTDAARKVGVRSEHPQEYTLSIGFNSATMFRDMDLREMSKSYSVLNMVVDEELFEKKGPAENMGVNEGRKGAAVEASVEKRWQETEDMVAKIMEVVGVLGEEELGLEVSVCLWNDFGRQF